MFVMVFEYLFSNAFHPTLSITAVIVSLPPTHSPHACLSFFWLHLLLLAIIFKHSSLIAYVLYIFVVKEEILNGEKMVDL